MKRTITILSTLLLLGLAQCSNEDAETSVPEPTDAADPSGKLTLKQLDTETATQTLKDAELAIDHARPLGVTATLDALRTFFTSKNIRLSVLENVTDETLGQWPTWMTRATASTASGSQSFALTQSERETYFECPLNAPDTEPSSLTCKELRAEVLPTLMAAVQKQQQDVEQWVRDNYQDLCTECQQFVIDWAKEAVQFGSDVARVDAWQQLYAEGVCDENATANEVAYYAGIRQGYQIVDSFRAQALASAGACGANTDAIVASIRVNALGQVSVWMKDKAVCGSADISKVNTKFQEAEAQREQGTKDGVEEALKGLEAEVWRATSRRRCGGSGDPVVIDLAGDGVQLISERVRFDLFADGSRPRTTWVGPRDGILARDVDGDGAITSAAELLSDRVACGDGLCRDGLQALAALDSPQRGGNDDGVLDARDPSFKQLLVWVDANSDGQSQPEELAPAVEHGLRSFRLARRALHAGGAAGALTGAVEVASEQGALRAFDAWFRVEATVHNLGALGPRH